MSEYQSISCDAHSIYELAIMRGQLIEVTIDGNIQTIKPQDMVTKSGEEFLIFIEESGAKQVLRIDYIMM